MMKPTGYVYSGSRACPRPRLKVFRRWCTELTARPRKGKGLIICLFRNVTGGRVPTPLGKPKVPKVKPEILVA